MKTIGTFLISLLFPFIIFAATVTRQTAEKVAVNFLTERAILTDQGNTKGFTAISGTLVRSVKGLPLYYSVDVKPSGFVLISAHDNLIPVLAYSFEGKFDRRFCNVSTWMKHYEDQIEYASAMNLSAGETIRNEWIRLSSDTFSTDRNSRSMSAVSPLLVSKWNQNSFYNGACPPDPDGPDGHCYAGCVATAMGQLLYYYRFPEQGQGSYTYVHPEYGTLSANFGETTYDWNGMPSAISKANPPIATLLFHQGVSVDMDYGPDGSGMWNHKAAYSLKTYFRYGPETQYYFRDSISLDWDSILITNLNQRKPLYYAGWAGVQSTSGHAFVCDGYQDTNYYHFNWGWGGTSDGYFYTDNLTPGGSNFNFAQEVIPLFPDTLLNIYPGYCSGKTVLTGVRGSIEDGSGWYDYQPNSNCSWLIKPQDPEVDSVRYIRLTFTKMNTEAGNDLIYVYDGDTTTAPLLGTFSGNTIPPVINSTGDKLLVVFQSNSGVNMDGFQADYESILPIYCSGTTTLVESSGSFGDGSGARKYNNSSLCRWKIQPPGAGAVTLTFTSFDLPDTNDVLRIYDQSTMELLAELSASQIPAPITSYSGKMFLMFITNKNTIGQGWEAIYTSSLVGMDENSSAVNTFSVSPNPAHSLVTIRVLSRIPDKAGLSLITTSGVTRKYNQLELHEGVNEINLDISDLPASVYFLTLTTTRQTINQKIVIN